MTDRDAQTPFDGAFENASTLLAVATPEGRLTRANRAVLEALGLPMAAVEGALVWEGSWFRNLPEEARRIREEMSRAARGEVVRQSTVAYDTASGERHFARRSLIPLRSGDGRRVESIVIECQDVTDRVLAERALREQEVELRSLVDHAFGFFCLVGVDGRVRRVNPASCIATGVRESEVVGLPIWEAPWWRGIEEEIRKVRETFESALERRPTRREVSYRAADGSIRFADHSVTPVVDDEGTVHDVVFEGLDITERLETQERLRRSEGRYRALVEQSHDGVILCTMEGRILDLNPAALEILRCGSHPEALGRPLADLLGNVEAIERALDAVREQGFAKNVELPGRGRDGKPRTLAATIGSVRDSPSDTPLLLVVVRDLTGWKALEGRLRHAQKLEALGRMAAGVAHEINNPLTWVLSNLEAVASDLETLVPPVDGDLDPSELALRVREAHEGAVRVARIVRDLKSFTRPEDEAVGRLDVNDVLEQALKLARNELRYRARVVVDTGDLPDVMACENRLLQVFLNLLLNAGQAIVHGTPESNEVRIRSFASRGEVRVEIEDTGCGIPEDHLDKLFDPFFTTKAPGVGSGLGLWICQGIITTAGGRIEVSSDGRTGSCFSVCLPAAPPSMDASRDLRHAVSDEGPRGRILVIEDEPYIRTVTARMLGRRHDVVTTGSAEEALELLARDPGFDLILCDLMMDALDGVRFREILHERDAERARRVAFMTGGAYDERTRRVLDAPECRWIEKPFDKRALLRFVEGILTGQAGNRAAPEHAVHAGG